MNTPARTWKIGLVGYGEVGRILAEDLRAQGLAVSAYDRKLDRPDTAPALRAHALDHGVSLCDDAADLARDVDLVVSAVTASQTVAVAQACAAGIQPGAFFLDFNSASPGAKQQAAALVNAAGGRYVEGAVMTSVPPYRIRVPLLLGGPEAEALCPAECAGLRAKVADVRLGVASATKMCRSVMIKGLEAMVIESFTAARHYGVEDAVVASLQETFPGIDWEKQASYFFQRVIEHGRRRSEEVMEVARTVGEAGLTPERRRHLAPPGLGGRPGRPGRLRPTRHARLCPQRRLARGSRPPARPHPTQGTPMSNRPTSGDFTKTPGWLDWFEGPSRPRFALPAGAVDAHCHVFGPGAEFPTPRAQVHPLRRQQAAASPCATTWALPQRGRAGHLPRCGQPRHGRCLPGQRGKARGVATVKRSISDEELQALHAAGVRGVRFNFVKRLVDFTPKDELMEIAGRIAKLGWHVVIYFEAVDLPELWDFFTALPTTVVVDHMGRPDVSQPVDGPSSRCS
jgi:3-hydroxyisobutyrate dehydrogenase-like beta-hydroxyacid dehydrogenase